MQSSALERLQRAIALNWSIDLRGPYYIAPLYIQSPALRGYTAVSERDSFTLMRRRRDYLITVYRALSALGN